MDKQWIYDYLENVKTAIDDKQNIEAPKVVANKLTGEKLFTEMHYNNFGVKLKDLDTFKEMIANLNFTTNITPEIEECLSPYGTFCDRINFFYRPEVFTDFFDFTEQQKIQIIACEIFNSMQDYFTDRNADITNPRRRGTTLLLMSHIGLTDERVPYANKVRSQLWSLFKETWPESTTISFGPNEKAGNFILKQIEKCFSRNSSLIERYGKVKNIRISKGKDHDLVGAYMLPSWYYPTEGSGFGLCYGDLRYPHQYENIKDKDYKLFKKKLYKEA